jgi:hypothetical protein
MLKWRGTLATLTVVAVAASLVIAGVFAFRVNWAEAWEKFLDKRVDIVANTISAVFAGLSLAILALASWEFQQFRQREFAKRARSDSRRAKLAILSATRDSLAAQVANRSENPDVVKDLLQQYRQWLKAEHLLLYEPNWRADEYWSKRSLVEHFNPDEYGQRQVRVSPTARHDLAVSIKQTYLPTEHDDSFPW